MKDSASGYRSMDFQTLLAWESWFGGCENPLGAGEDDWIDRLIAAGVEQEATVEQVLSALKDRILTDPDLADPEERVPLETLLGGPLSLAIPGNGNEEFEAGVRRICGVFLSSPQFQLGGVPGPSRLDSPPTLAVPGSSYIDYCVSAAESMFGGNGLGCGSALLEIE